MVHSYILGCLVKVVVVGLLTNIFIGGMAGGFVLVTCQRVMLDQSKVKKDLIRSKEKTIGQAVTLADYDIFLFFFTFWLVSWPFSSSSLNLRMAMGGFSVAGLVVGIAPTAQSK